MEKEPNIEDLLNIIKLQESALIYYSNKRNYSGDINKMPILKDRGEQAKFVLQQSEKIRNFEADLIQKLKDTLYESENINLEDSDTEETLNRINLIKGIFNKIKKDEN